MKARFIFLSVLSTVFLVITLPVGLAFLLLVCLYYVVDASGSKGDVAVDVEEDGQKDAEFHVSVQIRAKEDVKVKQNPKFIDLFNDDDFIREQENLR